MLLRVGRETFASAEAALDADDSTRDVGGATPSSRPPTSSNAFWGEALDLHDFRGR